VYEEVAAPAPVEVAEGEVAAAVTAPPPLEFPVSELEYMMSLINAINSVTMVMPEGMYMANAAGDFVQNPLYTMKYPDQLSSYVYAGGNLGGAVPGSWGIIYDSFKQLAIIRSFLYPGFFAYYSAVSNTVGNLYFGSGIKNKDLAFCV
jgi:radial spoke head protein 9